MSNFVKQVNCFFSCVRVKTALSVVAAFITLLFAQTTFAAPGDLDGSFGAGGVTTTNATSSAFEIVRDVLVDSSGKIVACSGGDSPAAVARYSSFGSLDASFGTNGIVTLNSSTQFTETASIVQQSDGKYVVAGYLKPNGSGVIARFNADGSFDTTFGSNGIVFLAPRNASSSASFSDVQIQADGKIVVVGTDFYPLNSDFVVARYTASGTLDTTFDGDGVAYTSINTNDFGAAVLLQSDSGSTKIVAVGTTLAADTAFALVRYNSDGSLDTTFNTNGIVVTANGSEANAAALQTVSGSTKIVVVGNNQADFSLAQYNSNGSLDTTFGTNGLVTTNAGGIDFARDVVIQPGGKIVVAGFTHFNKSGNNDIAVARYQTNGALDTFFDNEDGIVVTDLGSPDDEADAIAIQPNRRIIVAGTKQIDSRNDLAVLRYRGDRPNIASVEISGRITESNGRGIPGVLITLTGGDYNDTRYTYTTTFGYYAFSNVDASTSGNPYSTTPTKPGFVFTPSERILFNVVNDITDVDFVGSRIQ